jgi:hypothetical protein
MPSGVLVGMTGPRMLVVHEPLSLEATTIEYPTQRIFVKALLTHKEYDRKEWMKWAKH